MTTLSPSDPYRAVIEEQIRSRLTDRRTVLREAIKGREIRDRFWAKVDRSGGLDACWPWTGSRDTRGYGQFNFRYRYRFERAHRLAWMLASGRLIPTDRLACHTCDNPPCCNPRHLYAGTASQNMRDARDRGRTGGILLTWPQVEAIRASASPRSELAATYGVTPSTIHYIKSGRLWRA